MKKRLVALSMAVAMVASLTGCGNSSASSSASAESSTESAASSSTSGSGAVVDTGDHDSVTVTVSSDFGDLSPNGAFTDATRDVAYQVYEHLWTFDDDGNIIYRAATGYEYEDDTHLQIFLREGVTDTNGNEMTASDVLFAMNHCKDTCFGGDLAYIDFDNCKVIDDYTLEVALTQPYSMQIDTLSTTDLFDEDSYNESDDGFATKPIGYGAYELEEYVSGAYVVLQARDDYWGGEAQLKTVTLQVVTEESQKTNLLLSGSVDIVDQVPISDIETVESTDGLEIYDRKTFASHGIFFNMDSASACSDVHLRKAIAYCIDLDVLNEVAYEGSCVTATSGYSKGLSDYDEETWGELYEKLDNYYAYNIEKAKEELAQSAYPNGVTIRAIQTGTNNGDLNSQLVQSMLSEIGITMEIDQLDDSTANTVVKNADQWDMYFSGWLADASYVTAIASIQICNNNFCLWSGSEFDEFCDLVKKAEAATDREEFLELDSQVQEMSDDLLPLMGIADRVNNMGIKEGINLSFAFAYVYDFFNTTWD